MRARLAARAQRRPMAGALAVLALAVVVGAGFLVTRQVDRGAVTRVQIEPGGLLLTAAGEMRQLRATAYDAAGRTVEAGVTWTSSHQDAIAVSSTGLATAVAVGSAQLTAEVAGVRSVPALAIVSRPAPGVTLVGDEEVAAGPVETDPTAEPSLGNTYGLTLRKLRPAVGDRLIGTGGSAIAGEVVAVQASGEGSRVTMRLVPLPELLPDLRIDEVIDISAAPVVIPDEIARLYEVRRAANTFTFTPRPDFMQLLPTPGTSDRRLPAKRLAGIARGPYLAEASGTSALPPFTDCKVDTNPSSAALPIQLAAPPAFSVEVNPSLQVSWTPEDELQRFVASSTIKVKIDSGLKVTLAFEGKIGCEITLFRFTIPTSGPLSFFLAGVVPVKALVELAGKVTVASFELGTEVSAETGVELGLVCPGGGSCSLHKRFDDIKVDWKPRVDAPSLADLRLEPGLEVAGGIDLEIGNPLFASLRLDLVKSKVGAKLAADWAPQRFQIVDANYASSYALSLEAGASVGTKLTEIAELLGLGSIAAAELKVSTKLATSPTGKLKTDQQTYAAGASGTATVTMDQGALAFLGAYQVRRILLVRSAGGQLTTLASAEAANDQVEFGIPFQVTGPTRQSELYAFVVTRVAPIDLIGLELSRDPGCDAPPINAAWLKYILGLTFTAPATSFGGSPERAYFDPPPGGQGMALYFRGAVLPMAASGATFTAGPWGGELSIACKDATKVARLALRSGGQVAFEGDSRALPATPPVGD